MTAGIPTTRPTDLEAGNTFRAQNGEDRWLHDYFGGKAVGYFVDVGAYDGVDLSNSYHFEQIGWTGVLVEPDPDRARACAASRPRSKTFQCAAVDSAETSEICFHRAAAGVYSTTNLTPAHERRLAGMGVATEEIRVPARTLDSMLIEVGATKIDFVSIDVEGAELAVLRGFDIDRWSPQVVVVESNAKLRAKEIRDYFVTHGYAYCVTIDVNDFYCRAETGRLGVWLLDRIRYARHRFQRRASRIASNLRRSWRKRFGGKPS